MWGKIQERFRSLCAQEGREGVIAAVPVAEVRLLPEQAAYLRLKLAPLGVPEREATALSLGIAYHRKEIEVIPGGWTKAKPVDSRWDEYVDAYGGLNRCLRRVGSALAGAFGGVAEGPTRDGVVGQVSHVREYFPTCVSHRAFAETAGLGWRGKHGLIITPEFGPALRLTTVFLPFRVEAPRLQPGSCGECSACLEVCPVLRKGTTHADPDVYREMCRRRIKALALDADVCGICVRRCWEAVAR
jgi:epoxyqueuosine reductase QueG